VAHRIVIDGEGNYDPDACAETCRRSSKLETAMFGGIPYHDYTFILLCDRNGRRVEHLNSTRVGFRALGFATEETTAGFTLGRHSSFICGNVKRIRPDALGPFDYTKEKLHALLWSLKGITEYYGR